MVHIGYTLDQEAKDSARPHLTGTRAPFPAFDVFTTRPSVTMRQGVTTNRPELYLTEKCPAFSENTTKAAPEL